MQGLAFVPGPAAAGLLGSFIVAAAVLKHGGPDEQFLLHVFHAATLEEHLTVQSPSKSTVLRLLPLGNGLVLSSHVDGTLILFDVSTGEICDSTAFAGGSMRPRLSALACTYPQLQSTFIARRRQRRGVLLHHTRTRAGRR